MAGRWTAPHTHWVENGARRLQEFSLRLGAVTKEEFLLFETDWGPLHPTLCTVLLKGITSFSFDSREARLGTLYGDFESCPPASFPTGSLPLAG